MNLFLLALGVAAMVVALGLVREYVLVGKYLEVDDEARNAHVYLRVSAFACLVFGAPMIMYAMVIYPSDILASNPTPAWVHVAIGLVVFAFCVFGGFLCWASMRLRSRLQVRVKRQERSIALQEERRMQNSAQKLEL